MRERKEVQTMLRPLIMNTITLWNTLGNIFGLRASVVQDDSDVLPAVAETLKQEGYTQKIGGAVSSSGWQHSVHRFGDSAVIKISPPFEKEKVEKFVTYLQQQRKVLEKYCGPYLTEDQYYSVDLENGKGCYIVIKPWVKGKPLYKIPSRNLIEDKNVAEMLIDLLERGERMYRETGYALDIAEPGLFLSHFLSPKKTGNIIVSPSGKPFYIDTVLVPPNYDSEFMPKLYRFSPLWYFLYHYGVRIRLAQFNKQLTSYLC